MEQEFIESQDAICKVSSKFVDEEQAHQMRRQKKLQQIQLDVEKQKMQKLLQKQGQYCKINVSQNIYNKTMEIMRKKSVLDSQEQYNYPCSYEYEQLSKNNQMNTIDNNMFDYIKIKKWDEINIIQKSQPYSQQIQIDDLLQVKCQQKIKSTNQTSFIQKHQVKSKTFQIPQSCRVDLDLSNNFSVKCLAQSTNNHINKNNIDISKLQKSDLQSRTNRILNRQNNDMIIKYFPQ